MDVSSTTAIGRAMIDDKMQVVVLALQSIEMLSRIIKPDGGSSEVQIAAEEKILELIKLL
jgi:hypothetical protein